MLLQARGGVGEGVGGEQKWGALEKEKENSIDVLSTVLANTCFLDLYRRYRSCYKVFDHWLNTLEANSRRHDRNNDPSPANNEAATFWASLHDPGLVSRHSHEPAECFT